MPGLDPAGLARRTAGGTEYEVSGSGPPLLLIHGVGLDRTLWAPLRPALSERFLVITPDLLGHGGSAALPDTPSLRSFVDQMVALLDEIGIASAHVAGFSLGALVTIGLAAWHGDHVCTAVAMNSVFNRSAAEREAIMRRVAHVEEHGVAGTVDAAIERWFTPEWRAANPEREQQVRSRLLGNRPGEYAKAYRIFATGDAQLGGAVAQIDVPLLAVTGAEDPNSNPAMSRALAAAVPQATARILPGLRHMGLWEQPTAYIDAIEVWASGNRGGGPGHP